MIYDIVINAILVGDIRYPPFYYLLLRPLTNLDFRHVAYLLYVAQFLYFPVAGC